MWFLTNLFLSLHYYTYSFPAPPPPLPWAQQSCPVVRACEPAAACPYSASISPLLSGLLLGALLGIGF